MHDVFQYVVSFPFYFVLNIYAVILVLFQHHFELACVKIAKCCNQFCDSVSTVWHMWWWWEMLKQCGVLRANIMANIWTQHKSHLSYRIITITTIFLSFPHKSFILMLLYVSDLILKLKTKYRFCSIFLKVEFWYWVILVTSNQSIFYRRPSDAFIYFSNIIFHIP